MRPSPAGVTCYCSAEHQKAAWSGKGGNHKQNCARFKSGAVLPSLDRVDSCGTSALVELLREFGRADAAMVEV